MAVEHLFSLSTPVFLILQDASNRKRTADASPVKETAPKHPKNSGDVPTATTTTTIRPEASQSASEWQAIATETGWNAADCLSHKLSFPKKADPKAKMDVLGEHVKRLRAVGWHLYDEAAQIQSKLLKEQDHRAVEAQKHRETAATAAATATELAAKLTTAEATAARLTNEIEGVTKELEERKAALKETEASVAQLTGALATETVTADELRKKLSAAEATASDAQKYSSTLQEYNTKLQSDLATATEMSTKLQEEKAVLSEEAAALRGRVAALGDALSALQTASASNESMRQAAAEEAARLRADLAAACAERNSLQFDVTRLREENEAQRNEVERYKAVTGKDVAALEAERASNAALSSRTAAQAATVTALQDQLSLLKEQRAAAEAQTESKTDTVRSLTARVAELEALLATAEERVRHGESTRRRLHNTILELKGNVRVFCRVRPAASRGGEANEESNEKEQALKIPTSGDVGGRGIEIVPPVNVSSSFSSSSMANKSVLFTFDRVFGPQARQEEVFEEVSAMVQSALDGYHVTIFAYGQTNAGKTYTMLGSKENEGIIPRAVRQVFSTAEESAKEHGWKYTLRAAMLEIYNEELRDLLGKGPPAGKKHTINVTGSGNEEIVSYLEWVDVTDAPKVSFLLAKAMAQRQVAATAANDQSSRSHMVFMMSVEGVNSQTGQRLRGVINLVDLAGSERLARSQAEGQRLKETQAINKSLSALGDVIAALGARERHIPYRNSKLTHVLQPSLSGHGKCLMLCNVSGQEEDVGESLCTLRFAAKVNATEIGTARRNAE